MKMSKKILFFILFAPFSLFAVTIQDALKQKLIKIESIESAGRKSLSLSLQNAQKKHLNLEIPFATIFQPQDSSFQPIIITESQLLTLSANEKKTLILDGFCCNAPRFNPTKGSQYKVKEPATGTLFDIIKYLNLNKIQDDAAIQSAIWAATNQHRAEAISDETLKQYVAKVCGQTLRGVQVIYDQSSHPGEAAVVGNKLKVKGLFRYTTEKDIVANLCLYDENGKLLQTIESNLRHQRGTHKFGFYFEISNVKHSHYFVRLMSGKMMINEMEVNS